MSITLTAGSTNVALPDDLRWSDEDWSPVSQSASRGITGASILQVRALTAGRPITLEPPDESSAWMSRPVLEQLRNLAAIPGQVMTLTINGQSYSVAFRHQDTAIESEPVAFYSTPDPSDRFLATIRLMTV